jgi:hypothetical protein
MHESAFAWYVIIYLTFLVVCELDPYNPSLDDDSKVDIKIRGIALVF